MALIGGLLSIAGSVPFTFSATTPRTGSTKRHDGGPRFRCRAPRDPRGHRRPRHHLPAEDRHRHGPSRTSASGSAGPPPSRPSPSSRSTTSRTPRPRPRRLTRSAPPCGSSAQRHGADARRRSSSSRPSAGCRPPFRCRSWPPNGPGEGCRGPRSAGQTAVGGPRPGRGQRVEVVGLGLEVGGEAFRAQFAAQAAGLDAAEAGRKAEGVVVDADRNPFRCAGQVYVRPRRRSRRCRSGFSLSRSPGPRPGLRS